MPRTRSGAAFLRILKSGLPLTFVGIALFSPEEAHCCVILDFLWTIDDPDDLLKSANSPSREAKHVRQFFSGRSSSDRKV